MCDSRGIATDGLACGMSVAAAEDGSGTHCRRALTMSRDSRGVRSQVLMMRALVRARSRRAPARWGRRAPGDRRPCWSGPQPRYRGHRGSGPRFASARPLDHVVALRPRTDGHGRRAHEIGHHVRVPPGHAAVRSGVVVGDGIMAATLPTMTPVRPRAPTTAIDDRCRRRGLERCVTRTPSPSRADASREGADVAPGPRHRDRGGGAGAPGCSWQPPRCARSAPGWVAAGAP